jgi:CRISPR type IV-associated protein Csf3
MKPLRITWTFRMPVVLGDLPLHLDALLAYARVMHASQTGGDAALAHDDLPLHREGSVWAASQVVFTPTGLAGRQPMVRRLDIDALAMSKGEIWHSSRDRDTFTAGTGKFKVFDLRVDYAWMERADAWCLGHEETIRDLLGTISHLGRLTRNGWGEVDQCTISPATAAEAEFWRLRALPAGTGLELDGVAYARAVQGVAPPYWDRTRHIEASVPVEFPPH